MGLPAVLQGGVLQGLEEAGAERQRSAAGPVVPKEPDPAVEVAEAVKEKPFGVPGAFVLLDDLFMLWVQQQVATLFFYLCS